MRRAEIKYFINEGKLLWIAATNALIDVRHHVCPYRRAICAPQLSSMHTVVGSKIEEVISHNKTAWITRVHAGIDVFDRACSILCPIAPPKFRTSHSVQSSVVNK